MNHINEIAKLRDHIDGLETRLELYHSHLVDSVAQRDSLALDAAWGVLTSLTGISAFVSVYILFQDWLGLEGWALGVSSAVAGTIAQGIAVVYTDRGRFKDRAKFQTFPEWECKARALWENND